VGPDGASERVEAAERDSEIGAEEEEEAAI
jgi:hypothetical protein